MFGTNKIFVLTKALSQLKSKRGLVAIEGQHISVLYQSIEIGASIHIMGCHMDEST